jgi:hypothetical protein
MGIIKRLDSNVQDYTGRGTSVMKEIAMMIYWRSQAAFRQHVRSGEANSVHCNCPLSNVKMSLVCNSKSAKDDPTSKRSPRFNTANTQVRHWTRSWASESVSFTPQSSQPIPLGFILITGISFYSLIGLSSRCLLRGIFIKKSIPRTLGWPPAPVPKT